MANIETIAKQDAASMRRGVRLWMANHPFLSGAIACAAGALAVLLAAIAW